MRISYICFISILFVVISATPVFPKNAVKDRWQEDVPREAVELVRNAMAKTRQFRTRDAMKDFKAALEVKKDYYWATFNLALAYTISSGDHSDVAEETFFSAVAIAEKYDIKDPSLYDTFGQFYFKHEEYTKALEQFYKALNISKKYVRALNNIGAVYEVLGKREQALTHYEKAMNLGLPIAKINYQRLFAQVKEEEDFSTLPSTYFTNKRRGDPITPPTHFDNSGTPGMPARKK